jgi:hypothetical protein
MLRQYSLRKHVQQYSKNNKITASSVMSKNDVIVVLSSFFSFLFPLFSLRGPGVRDKEEGFFHHKKN